MADFKFSSAGSRLRRSEIRELLKLTRQPGTISFGGGLPDPEIFPYEAVESASLRTIRERGRLALQYSPTEGEPFLREQIAAYLRRQGEPATMDELLVVSSSQQALDLLGKIFIDPGDPIIIERPTYLGAIQAFRLFDADFVGVDMDEEGILPDRLEGEVVRLTREGRKPKFVYLIPDFQNPSGINLTLERRKEVLRIASEHDLLIVEDSPYRELRFSGELIPSIRSLDTEGRVIQLKTLSKIFSPGFRLGWIVAPPLVQEKLVMAKQGTDLCTSAYVSIMAAYLLADGYIEKQVRVARDLYARKAAVMLDALNQFMPPDENIWWSRPEGGVFLWLHLPECVDVVEMIPDAVEAKVAYVIGTGFYTDGSGHDNMRLNYSYPTEADIVEGIRRLAGLIARRLVGESVL